MSKLAARLNILCLLLGFSAAAFAVDEPELRVSTRTADVQDKMALGSVEVAGVGAVELIAERQGGEVVVRAVGQSGEVLGRAQATVGLRQTPIYIKAGGRLQKVSILWDVGESTP